MSKTAKWIFVIVPATERILELWCAECAKPIARSPHNSVLKLMERAHLSAHTKTVVKASAMVSSIVFALQST